MKKSSMIIMAALVGILSGCGNSAVSEQPQAQEETVAETESADETEPDDSAETDTEAKFDDFAEAGAQEERAEAFVNLKIEVSEGTIRIRSGEAFSLPAEAARL